jgi:hypothetical protein
MSLLISLRTSLQPEGCVAVESVEIGLILVQLKISFFISFLPLLYVVG